MRNEIGPHGHPMAEALSPLADPFKRLPGGWRYLAHRSIDRAQQSVSAAQADLAKRYPDADFSADIWTVEKVWND